MQLNVLKGAKEALVSKELMGRAAIPLRPFHDKPGEAVDAWYDLGKGEWSNDDGTVRAAGRRPRCSAHGQRSGAGFMTGWSRLCHAC